MDNVDADLDSPQPRSEPRRRHGRTTRVEYAELAEGLPDDATLSVETTHDTVAAVVDAHKERLTATLAAIDDRHATPRVRLTALARELRGRREREAAHGRRLGGRAPGILVPVD